MQGMFIICLIGPEDYNNLVRAAPANGAATLRGKCRKIPCKSAIIVFNRLECKLKLWVTS